MEENVELKQNLNLRAQVGQRTDRMKLQCWNNRWQRCSDPDHAIRSASANLLAALKLVF